MSLTHEFNKPGNVLISDQFNNRVVECDKSGRIIWFWGLGPNDFSAQSIIGVNDAERVGENTLLTGTGTPPGVINEAPAGAVDNRVILVDKNKNILWQYGQFGQTGSGFDLLNAPVQATYISAPHHHIPASTECENECEERDCQRENCGRRKHDCERHDTEKHGRERRKKYDYVRRDCEYYDVCKRDEDDSKKDKCEKGHCGNSRCDKCYTCKHHKYLTCYRCEGRSESKDPLKGDMILITDQGNNRVILVNGAKQIVWSYPGSNTNPGDQLDSPNSAQLLKNGNYLIADELNSRALEVGRNDQVIRVFTAQGTLGECAFASRLDNGNTLLTDASNQRIVEVNINDEIVWVYYTNTEYLSLEEPTPTRGLRLRNGRNIISNQFNNQVLIVNGNMVVKQRFGLPLTGQTDQPFGIVGTNHGFDVLTTQLGLYAPYDAKIIGDYTGLTPP